MCNALPAHDGPEPPRGEAWCQVRLAIEVLRWLEGYPMTCGEPTSTFEVPSW